MKPELLHELFERADAAEIGIKIKTNNARKLLDTLTAYRAHMKLWDNLMIATPSVEGFLFIIHKSVELD